MTRRIAVSVALAAAALSAGFMLTAPPHAERPSLLAEAPEVRVSPLPAHSDDPLDPGQTVTQ